MKACRQLMLALALAGSSAALQAQTQTPWTAIRINGFSGATVTEAAGFNDLGQVVGHSVIDGQSRAFLYSNGTLSDLGSLGGGGFSSANGINNLGQIVGVSSDTPFGPGHAFLYSNGQMTRLTAAGEPSSSALAINRRGDVIAQVGDRGTLYRSNGTQADLGTLGGWQTTPQFINESGQVAGRSVNAQGFSRTFFYNQGSMTEVPGGSEGMDAFGFNNAGQIALSYRDANMSGPHAGFYSNGTLTDLGTMGGWASLALGINNSGQVIGNAAVNAVPGGDDRYRAFIYGNGAMTDISADLRAGALSSWTSQAVDINDRGQVLVNASFNEAGRFFSRLFLWDHGIVTDLTPWLEQAAGIDSILPNVFLNASLNEVGQVLVRFAHHSSGAVTPYLLTPVPEPATFALMLAGLLAFGMVQRRRVRSSRTGRDPRL